jgi:hypothetical protein
MTQGMGGVWRGPRGGDGGGAAVCVAARAVLEGKKERDGREGGGGGEWRQEGFGYVKGVSGSSSKKHVQRAAFVDSLA